MIRVQYLLAACLAITVLTQNGNQDGVKSLLNPSTQQTPESSQPEESDLEEEQRIQAEVAEIMAIRKRLGGGVSERLKGFSIEMPTGKEGGEQVLDVGVPMIIEEAFAKQLTLQSRNSAAKTGIARNESVEPVSVEHAEPAHQRRESVRHAARMLEEAAAVLEEANEYDQADNIRKTAGELWRTARLR